MSIAEKLTIISENVGKVYDAGFQKGKAETAVSMPTYEKELAAQQAIEDAIMQSTVLEYQNDRITKLGQGGLTRRRNLKKISLPAVTAIEEYSVYECDALTFFDAPLATTLGTAAFYGCESLQRLDFPNITSISTHAFINCSALTALILRSGSVCSLGATTVFTGSPIASGTGYVYVPDDLLDTYKTATNWVAHANQIKPISELEETA